ncbi:MAG: cytochrome b/b6 domain-containing protein [Desulfatirhabdiaceae bacterium]
MAHQTIHRHTRLSIFMHWFNAVCWFFLLLTGLGLIRNDALQVFPAWPLWMRSVFGSPENLLLSHETVGIIWAGGFLIYGILLFRQEVIPFIREILTVEIPRDSLWLITKGIQMTLGYRALEKIAEKFGFDPRIPDQGFYNVGQKLFAIPSILGGVVIALTGFVMILSQYRPVAAELVQWSIVIHFITVGLVFAGLLIHIFMAAIAKGEQPALISMFTGTVPEDYAHHHHKLWLDEIRASDASKRSPAHGNG